MSTTFSLAIVRYLFRRAFRSTIENIGLVENVFVEQNKIFQPKLEQIHVTEHVTTLDERIESLGGMFTVRGYACYEVCSPAGKGASSGETVARQLIDALPVGDYLRDDAPGTGTGCSILVLSARLVGERKHPTLLGWYVAPIEISWNAFYFR